MNAKLMTIIRPAIPCVAVLLSAAVVCGANIRLQAAKEDRTRAQLALAAAEEAKANITNMGGRDRFATEANSGQESAMFLSTLRQYALEPKSTILKWTSSAKTYEEPGEDGNTSPGAVKAINPVVAGLTRVTSEVELQGSYESLRRFLQAVTLSKRLYTIQDVQLTRDKVGCRVSFELTRYVAPAEEPSSVLARAGGPEDEVRM